MRRALTVLALCALIPLAYAAQPKKRPEDPVAGKEIWDRSCWQCHGKTNAGDGPAAASLRGGVPDLRNTVTPERYDALIEVILQGKGLMPAYGAEFNNFDAKRILIYLTKLDTDGPPKEEDEKDEPAAPKAPAQTPAEEPELIPPVNPGGI